MDKLTTLVARIPDHPEAAPVRTAVEAILAVSTRAQGRAERLRASKKLTTMGVRDDLRSALTRDLKDARWAAQPVREARANLETAKAALKRGPSYDRSDLYALQLRVELRAVIAGLRDDERLLYVTSSRDPRVVEAILEVPATVSGVDDSTYQKLVERRRQKAPCTAVPNAPKLERRSGHLPIKAVRFACPALSWRPGPQVA